MKFTEQEIGDVVQAQRARGGDKAAVFHHFGEHQQLVEICLRHQPTPAKKTQQLSHQQDNVSHFCRLIPPWPAA